MDMRTHGKPAYGPKSLSTIDVRAFGNAIIYYELT